MIQISYIIPTLNAENVLDKCLKSIINQKYLRSKYEILIIDGGSVDKTCLIAQKYHSKILKNPFKTAEAGKAIGVKQARGKFICLIDSDNILPNSNWLSKMLYPFTQNSQIIGSEPIKFTYRPHAGIIERYSALIGANDPYAFITGVYDKKNFINNKWTNLKIDQIDKHQYFQISLKPKTIIPTIGANGTIFKSDFLKNNLKSDYLFDIDIISQVIQKTNQPILFAKVKTGIIHTYCESSIKKFIRKQHRRLVDYYTYQPLRNYQWHTNHSYPQTKFILYSLLVIPALIDSFRGFTHHPDFVWFLHPFFCFITLLTYTFVTLQFKLGILKPINRELWQQ